MAEWGAFKGKKKKSVNLKTHTENQPKVEKTHDIFL